MNKLLCGVLVASVVSALTGLQARQSTPESVPDLRWFFEATSHDKDRADAALEQISPAWRDGYAAMIIDLARLMRAEVLTGPSAEGTASLPADEDSGNVFAAGGDIFVEGRRDPNTVARGRLTRFLKDHTDEDFGADLGKWREWMWSVPYEPHPQYAEFKGHVFAQVDPRMQAFFPPDVETTIRLDEVEWGGVAVNGIPPLEYPEHTSAEGATYLKDDHVVFGLAVGGEARAYPKRIIAWHEMVHDQVGGIDLTIVYCTLCGTVIPYESVLDGHHYRLGTSGLLYRSNKLMFDEQTMSLWSTFEGKPVIGPLVGTGVQLAALPVVTTTWGEWRQEHPDTLVLSIDTGFERDYGEGAAYRSYFSTDRLMFPVPNADKRLKNKDEVLVMRVASTGAGGTPIAIAAKFLKRHRVYQAELGGVSLSVLTSREGANRVYRTDDVRLTDSYTRDQVTDAMGRVWRVTEDALVLDGESSTRLERVPAQRAFWFGWHAQFPDTELVK